MMFSHNIFAIAKPKAGGSRERTLDFARYTATGSSTTLLFAGRIWRAQSLVAPPQPVALGGRRVYPRVSFAVTPTRNCP